MSRALIPGRPLEHARPDGLHRQRVSRQAVGGVAAGHDHGSGAVAGRVAVIQAQRLGDHPRAEVVVHRHRFAVDRVGVESGVGAGIDRDAAEMLTGQAEVVHIALGGHRQPIRRRQVRRTAPTTPGAGAIAAAEQHRSPAAAGLLRGGGFPHRPIDHDVVGQPETDRHARLDRRADLARGLQRRDVPAASEGRVRCGPPGQWLRRNRDRAHPDPGSWRSRRRRRCSARRRRSPAAPPRA